MSSQKTLEDSLRFLDEFRMLFDVVQQASLAQLRRSDERVNQHVSVTELITNGILPMMPNTVRSSPWLRSGAGDRLLVIMTSDEGLVGPLHAAVVRQALAAADAATRVWFVGQRGQRWLGRRAAPVEVMPMPDDEHVGEAMRALGERLLGAYRREGLRDVWLASARYLSSARQDVLVRPLLPLPATHLPSPSEELRPLIEPSLDRIVEGVAGLWVVAGLQEACWSSRRAEFAARALHVEISRQELTKRTRLMRYAIFKAMHERLDVMVRESCVVQRHAASRLQAAHAIRRH